MTANGSKKHKPDAMKEIGLDANNNLLFYAKTLYIRSKYQAFWLVLYPLKVKR